MSELTGPIQVSVASMATQKPGLVVNWTMADGRSFTLDLACDTEMAALPGNVQSLLLQALYGFHNAMFLRWRTQTPNTMGWYWHRTGRTGTAYPVKIFKMGKHTYVWPLDERVSTRKLSLSQTVWANGPDRSRSQYDHRMSEVSWRSQ